MAFLQLGHALFQTRDAWLELCFINDALSVTVDEPSNPTSQTGHLTDEGEEPARAPIEDEQSAVAILHSCRVDDDVQQQAERVDQDMPFAAGDLLGRIKALRVKRGAPF